MKKYERLNHSSLNLFFRPHSRVNDTREVLLRLTAHHDDPKALGLVALETIPVRLYNLADCY